MNEKCFTKNDEFVICSKKFWDLSEIAMSLKFHKAGPRQEIYFNPTEVKAAIVSCGGLCPGLNVVIREIFMCLHFSYGVDEVYGVKWGYNGFWQDPEHWVKLNTNLVKDIHKKGGSIIGAAWGGFDKDKICDSLIEWGINLLFIIGGDGTHFACNILIEEINKWGLNIAVCGIPKTIDNDIPLIDKSFGYETSCEYANNIIEAANVEAECIPNGVGLVKVMGWDSGFIAMNASLANWDVNLCLIPESKFMIEGPHGICA